MQPTKEGFIPFRGYRTYYKIIGEAKNGKLPLIVIAGGPGSPHNYLLDLRHLADSGRQVVFYDQLGCGQSDRPDDTALWVVETFVEELAALRKALGLEQVHLLGHSWGGMLAVEYLLTRPAGVCSAVLSSAMISMPLFAAEMKKLRAKLPKDVEAAMRRHEADGTVDDPEYTQAYAVFNRRHIYQPGPEAWPAYLNGAPGSFGTEVYRYMWGLSEPYPNGTLKDWDRLDRLREITLPVLITSGRNDELTPAQADAVKKRLPRAEQKIFELSAHMAPVEEPAEFRETIERFLEKVEHAETTA